MMVSTNVKTGHGLKETSRRHGVSANSFRHGWKVAVQCRNVQLSGGHAEIHLDSVSRDAIPTNVEYQYGDLNLLAASCAAEQRTSEPQPGEPDRDAATERVYYDGDCQRNEENIRRKREKPDA